MRKALLIDLDGTLVDTAHPEFKAMQDGQAPVDLQKINPFPGAIEFIQDFKRAGHLVHIISDSHPRYVEPVVNKFFKVPHLSLADKPNIIKTQKYLRALRPDFTGMTRNDFFVVGDKYLDVELGRGLKVKTIRTGFYIPTTSEELDGFHNSWNDLKSGPTFTSRSYHEIQAIVKEPGQYHWCLEAFLQGKKSARAIKVFQDHYNQYIGATLIRALGRQEEGECDRHAIQQYYQHFSSEYRAENFKDTVSGAVSFYLQAFLHSSEYNWDYLTYITDKATTKPRNKMKEIFDRVETNLSKKVLFQWSNKIIGSIRHQPDYKSRVSFVGKYLSVSGGENIQGKSIVIIDDQITTGATARSVIKMLREKGAGNILFLSLFLLITSVESSVICPKCGKLMRAKYRKQDGRKFYSCVPPKYRGDGCGNILNA